jgi:hypothetical protein
VVKRKPIHQGLLFVVMRASNPHPDYDSVCGPRRTSPISQKGEKLTVPFGEIPMTVD